MMFYNYETASKELKNESINIGMLLANINGGRININTLSDGEKKAVFDYCAEYGK